MFALLHNQHFSLKMGEKNQQHNTTYMTVTIIMEMLTEQL